MKDLYERLRELSEGEVRNLLNDLLKLTVPFSEQGDGEQKALADSIVQMYEMQVQRAHSSRLEAEQRKRTVHLVFSMSDAGSLKVALSKLGKRADNEVLTFNDCFSVGPIKDLDRAEGQRAREFWQMEKLSGSMFNHLMNREHQIERVIEKISAIAEHKSIIIWCADNAHDQVGLRFVMHLLKNRSNSVHIMNVSELFRLNMPSTHENIPHYAQGLLEEDVYLNIVKEYEHVLPLVDSERRRFEAEWLELKQHKHTLRLWVDGKIEHAAEEALDRKLMAVVDKLAIETEDGFVKAGAVIGELQDHYFQLIDFRFTEYRLWTLISDGYLAFRGLPGAMHQYSVRMNTGRTTL
ncbi:DUF1835 domain-containing protein [Bacillus sp. FJAT-28004]|uniref:DUF1835 domain-containing protein n=1 Tax=Bacillus sp. FJAT-28004 TaxID=1679165 RepID=UPI0006B61772|nr:DUF1835 domain-containing protein [Bacillus sp. FJAT-28004]